VRKLTTLLASLLMLMIGVMPAAAEDIQLEAVEGQQFTKTGIYLVRLADAPVVAYDGGIQGIPATRPGKNQKINPNSAAVRKYADYLTAKHDATLGAVGAQGKKAYSYVYSLNGFAATLTPGQANKLARTAGIVSVEEDVLMHVDTNRTPEMLGLNDDPGGIWNALGGVGSAGEGVVVGIIDTGIWPESASFSDRTGTNKTGKTGKLGYQQLPGWHGKCTPGEQFTAANCNQKLIGAQWFNAGFGGNAGINAEFPDEFVSPRDADGHGSHTASTAAGNHGVEAVIDGQSLGPISGMAPRARIAAYKVCWGGDAGGCFGSDSVAAIDQAVADGVDVLNFSISGTGTNYLDAVEVAFLFAADAGVFVAASAGNSGPGAATVAHISPWLMTVAAGTKDDDYSSQVELGNGSHYDGKSRTVTEDVTADLVYAGDVKLESAALDEAKLCYAGTLDPAKVDGKIVVCDRGVIARTDKSLAVKEADGVGMILANTSPSSVNADMHFVPTVHVDEVAGAAITAYAQIPGATATLKTFTKTTIDAAPNVATFSSRGPNRAGGDLLKPDIMAPGEDILAAVSPVGNHGRDFDFLSGTSMSSPHIAGIGALMKDAHPDWSPAAIKSALMTTSSTVRKDGTPIAGGPFAYGAGHVVPNSAVDPGLVYDAGFNDWLRFLCGTGQLTASYCPSIAIDPSDLNYPSIAIGDLAGIQTVTRTVTNVGSSSATYNAAVSAPAGIDVVVNPSSLTLDPGASASFTVTFTRTTAALNSYAFGQLIWSDGTHSVQSPLVVRPVAIAAPAEVSGTGASGSTSFDVTFGYTGTYEARAHGLFEATETPGTVADDPDNDITVNLGPGKTGITVHTLVMPAGTSYARFSLFDDFTDGNDDLDLYVFTNPNLTLGSLVGSSGSGTSAEQVNLRASAPGGLSSNLTLYVVVHGWQTDGSDADYTLFSWNIPANPASDDGSLTASGPASATLGGTGTVNVGWSGLTSATKYLGAVTHFDGTNVIGTTIVSVDVP